MCGLSNLYFIEHFNWKKYEGVNSNLSSVHGYLRLQGLVLKCFEGAPGAIRCPITSFNQKRHSCTLHLRLLELGRFRSAPLRIRRL